MKGLLLKDFYNLAKLMKQYVLILAAMSIWAYFMKNPSLISMYVVLCSAMLAQSSFSYDEYVHFDKYALTMPIGRSTLVREKFVLLLLTVLGGTVIGVSLAALLNLIWKGDFVELLVVSLVIACVFLLSNSISFVGIFKYGIEKARLLMVGSYLGIFVLVFGMAKLFDRFHIFALPHMEWLLPVTAVIITLLILCLCCFLSLRVVKKKEW